MLRYKLTKEMIDCIDNNNYDQADVINLKMFYEKFKILIDILENFKESEKYKSGEIVDITNEMQEASKAWKKLLYLPPIRISQIKSLFPEIIEALENIKKEDTFQMQKPIKKFDNEN